jgi:HEAT repeat protein
MKKRTLVPFFASLALLSACANKTAPATNPPPPRQVPSAPTAASTPLDPALRESARQVILSDVRSDDEYLRANAIEALSRVDPNDAQEPILKGLSDPAPSVRYTAAIAAGELKIKLAYTPLLAMVKDGSLQVQVAVRFALHMLGDTRLSHELEKYARDFDSKVRASTVQVLGMMGEPSAANVLVPMLKDPAPSVRIQAAEALWRLSDEQGLEDLVAYSISQYPDDQIIAVLGLAEPHDQRVIQHVRGALTSDYIEVSLVAARAMGMLGSDEGWNVAVPKATADDPRQRGLAALALGAIGRPDLQPVLAPMLKDVNPSVQLAAATAILQLHQ